ncbi:MAG: protoheme IX farnesyltransferase [Flavobacteriales bacterium MED-G15]|nr:MAG: protoheme IX farnesyltransferase [Flavobacteriales bacterium MED-G15]|tara:strand:+ start:166 stop:1071 length:906 start_codon:yes stop_codon:yes gene_type:complete
MKTHSDSLPLITLNIGALISDFLQLTKFRLAVSVVFSSVAGYLLAADQIQIQVLLGLFFGGFAMVGASNAFNQWIEKDRDALMIRTKNRPLPAGRMNNLTAVIIASVLTILGIIILQYINYKTALFGALSIFIYTCIYTPLKTLTPLAVFVGAFPGAIPFMLGWVAATGSFGIEPGILFMVQFFWQFPHFWAIGWMMDEDYKKAGFKMLPTGNPDRATAFQIVFYTLWTIIISILPYTRYSGELSLSLSAVVALIIIGGYFLFFALKLMQRKTKEAARKLMYASIAYISLLQIIYVLDKWI